MIIKGGSCGGAARIAAHLLNAEQNERAEIVELHGVMAGDLRGALREMETVGGCSRTKRPLYHASINPRAHERMTAEQWGEAVDRLESALGLEGQPRAVIEHSKDGRAHRHVVWLRIDLAKGAAISDSHNFRKHEQVARELEREFGFERVQGAHIERKGRKRPARTPSHDEMQQGARTSVSPKAAKTLITALWRGTTTGKEFAEAVSAAGWTLARGDRRDFVLIDPKGGVHSLARRIEGANAREIRARMGDLDPAGLPSVKQVRATMRPRPVHRRAGSTQAKAAPRPTAGRWRAVRLPSGRRFMARAGELTRRPQEPRERVRERGRPTSSQHGAGVELRRQQENARVKGGAQAEAASPRRGNQPRAKTGKQSGAGLYVTVSRQRLDYARPCVQAGANGNLSLQRWTRARIKRVGEFRAQALMIVAPVVSPRAEAFEKPERPDAARSSAGEPVESGAIVGAVSTGAGGGEDGGDNGLGGLLAAIAAEVQGRAAAACAALSAQFAGGIEHARMSLPRDQVAGAVAALKQVMAAAMKAVQEAAAMETKGRQGAASVWSRARTLQKGQISNRHKLW